MLYNELSALGEPENSGPLATAVVAASARMNVPPTHYLRPVTFVMSAETSQIIPVSKVRDSSVRAALAYSLGMTDGRFSS